MLVRLKEVGDRAVVHELRQRPSNRRLNEKTRESTVRILSQEVYRGFGPTLASEYLARQHKIHIGREALRLLMQQAGLWRSRKEKVEAIHQWRPRRSRRGELVQWDTSDHDWQENKGKEPTFHGAPSVLSVPAHTSPAGEARPSGCSSAASAFPFESIDPALFFGLIRPWYRIALWTVSPTPTINPHLLFACLSGGGAVQRHTTVPEHYGAFSSTASKIRLLSRICGAILVPGVVPSCDKGQFP